MRMDLIRGSLTVIVLTIVLGLAYPLAMTGISQLAFPGRADGSLIRSGGRVVGSELLATAPGKRPDPRYFQPRPSATGWSAEVTYFANKGPNQKSTRDATRAHIAAYLRLEQPYDPGLTAAAVPIDAATFSASGVDPHISQANAAIQARRVAAVRRLPIDRVRALVSQSTDGRALGLFGEPGVNVTRLNLALDQEAR